MQVPHVDVGEVKLLSGDFDLFTLTHVGVRVIIVGGQGAGSVEMRDIRSR